MMPYRVRVLMFNATFNNISVISWRSVLLVEEMPFETIFLLLAGADSGGGGRPKIGKNMIFWRKIVIFHTKYPNNFRASLRSAQFF